MEASAAKGKKRRVVVSLSLEVPPYELEDTPSRKDGLSAETETDMRIWCCQFIQDTGILLRMPQVVMACAQILFQRFYYRRSMIAFDVKATAMACLFLAAKVEESPNSLRNIVHTGHHVQQKVSRAHLDGRTTVVVLESGQYSRMKNEVIKAERRVLKELGFCVHLKHPHKLIISYQQMIGLQGNKELAQLAWNYMNDGLRTSVFMRFPAPVIACACLHLGTRKLGISMPEWWPAFDVETQDLDAACSIIMSLYSRPRRFLADLERDVSDARAAKEARRVAAAESVSRRRERRRSLSPKGERRDSKIRAVAAVSAQPRRRESPLIRRDRGLVRQGAETVAAVGSAEFGRRHRSRSPRERDNR